MRIIAKNHDYYDSVQSMDREPLPLYLRNEKEVIVKRQEFPFLYRYGNGSLNIIQYIVGFCGKIYPILQINKRMSPIQKWCFTLDDVVNFVKDNHSHKDYVSFCDKSRGKWAFFERKHDFEKYFEECKQKQLHYNKYFEIEKSPIFSVYQYPWASNDKVTLTYNGELKQFEFYKLFPPYQAYQEILQFMSNFAEPERPIPSISNDDMIRAKGFNLKTSFRKSPS